MLVDDNAAHLPPSLEQANAYHEARGAAIEKQQLETVKYDDQREARMREVHKDKIEKKRGEREKAREGLAKLPVEGEVVEIFVPDLPEGERTTGPPPSLLPTASTSRPLNTVSYLITIKLSSKKEAWYDPASATYSDLEAAGAAGLWNYPTTPLQASRCKVFEDLWRKGHFMGGGLRFGGDFLVYPGSSLPCLSLSFRTDINCTGDPLRFHSHFTLTVLSSPNSTILPLDLIAYGRLATAVKKAHLLASWNEKEEKADYFSLEWAAFG